MFHNQRSQSRRPMKIVVVLGVIFDCIMVATFVAGMLLCRQVFAMGMFMREYNAIFGN